MKPDWATAEDYRELSVAARLAAALHTFTRWQQTIGLIDARIDACTEGMWNFLTITPDTFHQWYEVESEALEALLNKPIPADLARSCIAVGVDAATVQRALGATAEIIFGNVYTRVDNEATLAELAKLEQLVNGSGIQLPPALQFATSPYPERHGWGHIMTRREVDEWRHVTW